MPDSGRSFVLPRVPASFFGMVLGLAGLANCWRLAASLWAVPKAIGECLFAFTGLIWLVLVLLYLAKWIVAPDEARAEAEHAIQCCFIGLCGVATLLIAQGILPYTRWLAILLFALGAGFTLLFGIWRTGKLWRGSREATSTTPILYLPTVAGGFVTGTTAAALGWSDWGQLAFGAAFFSWLAIESVLLHRLYHADALPAALRPTLGIQLAPPAVGAVCYLATGTGHSDMIVHAMLGYALLQALILIRLGHWIGEQPFSPAYWAFTFGATSLAGAALKLSSHESDAISFLAPALFVLANLVVAAITLGTLRLLVAGRLTPPAGAK